MAGQLLGKFIPKLTDTGWGWHGLPVDVGSSVGYRCLGLGKERTTDSKAGGFKRNGRSGAVEQLS